MGSRVVLSQRAARDLRRIGRGDTLTRLREAIAALEADDASVDVRALSGAAPWQRLRVGDYRVRFRRVEQTESPDAAVLVARVIHRRDLERAIKTLE